MGLVASSEVPLRLEGVRVPASSVLGERGEGFGLALRVLGYSRTALGAACIRASWKILEEAVHHTKERAAFHRKLIDIEMVREKLARVAANLYMMESITYYAAHLLDAGEADPMRRRPQLVESEVPSHR